MNLDENDEYEDDFKQFVDTIILSFLREVSEDKNAIEELNEFLLSRNEKITSKEEDKK